MLLNDGRFPLKLREEIGGAMAQQNSPEARHALLDALRLAPQRLQIKHAQALAGTAEGADALLHRDSRGAMSQGNCFSIAW